MSETTPLLPSIVRTSQGPDCCGCSMCYNQETDTPITGVGPHDLHCLCEWCFSTPCTDRQCDEQFAQRYPEHFTFNPEDYDSDVEEFTLTDSQIQRILEDTFYHPPSTSPTNHDMHSYNGNHGHPGIDIVNPEITTTYDHTHHNPMNPFKIPARVSQFIHNLKHDYNVHQHNKIDAEARNFKLRELEKYNLSKKAHTNLKSLEKLNKDLEIQNQSRDINSDEQKTLLDIWIHGRPSEVVPKEGHEPKPTNKTMHAENGNLKKFGPMTLKQAQRKERRKVKRALKKKEVKTYLKTIKNGSAPFPLPKPKPTLPKGVKKAGKIETQEQKLAKRYTSFLKNPVYQPPRLGSTGNNPTKILQGYAQVTIKTATAANGSGASDCIAFLSPKMFRNYTDDSHFAAPLSYGFAVNSTTPFVTGANATFTCGDFANYQPLANEAGIANRSSDNTLTRWLGGHVSIKCRCPIMNSAMPLVYAGLMPSQPMVNGVDGTIVDPAKQLNQLTTSQIRMLKSTNEQQGVEAAAIYIPAGAEQLQFNNLVTDGSLNFNIPNYPVPYVGFTGCDTSVSTTIMITFVGWFEIQQNQNNMNYSGWRLGPKLSTEDIYDFIPRSIKPYAPVAKAIATKNDAGVSASLQMMEFLKPKAVDPHLELDEFKRNFRRLQQQYEKLSLIIEEEEEEEKYITTSPPDTPKQSVNLSQSTINLALALKDRLTPGSVTSKTAKISLP